MVARKRKTGEKFSDYKENLKAEARWLRERLKGSLFYQLKENQLGKFIPYKRKK